VGKIVIISDVGVRFGYPHNSDLAELLARRGCEVEILMPETDGIAEWNQGRGFRFVFVTKPSISLPGWSNIRFLTYALWHCRRAKSILISLPPSLLVGLVYNVLFGRRVAYWSLELMLFGTKGGGTYTALQRLLPWSTIKVWTSCRHRSRVLGQATGLTWMPGAVSLAALRNTTTRVTYQDRPLAERVRLAAGAPQAIVVMLNGALNEVNCLDMILEAEVPAASGVMIGMVGVLIPAWRARVEEARRRTGNYIHVGELAGNRYDLIRALRGTDVGLVIKRYDARQTMNDRLYTPTKLFDFIAAGVPTICSGQPSLRFVEAEGLGFRLGELTTPALREALLSLPDRGAELRAMAARVAESFQTRHNLEASSRELIEHLA
jgi:type IV secretory pathway TrbD component